MTASLAVVLLVSACGGGAPAPVATAPAASPVPVGTPQPSLAATASITASVAPAASASSASAHLATTYLALALKGDASIVKCDAAQAAAAQNLSQTKLSRAKAAALACLALYDSYTAGLQGMAWGAAQPRADAVIAAMATIHSLLAEMSNATTSAAFRAAYDKMPAATTALRTAANALRAALSLPPS